MAASNPNRAKGSISALTAPLGRAALHRGMLLGPRKQPGSESGLDATLVRAHHSIPSPGRLRWLGAALGGAGASPSPSCLTQRPAASWCFMNIKHVACEFCLDDTSCILPSGSEEAQPAPGKQLVRGDHNENTSCWSNALVHQCRRAPNAAKAFLSFWPLKRLRVLYSHF